MNQETDKIILDFIKSHKKEKRENENTEQPRRNNSLVKLHNKNEVKRYYNDMNEKMMNKRDEYGFGDIHW